MAEDVDFRILAKNDTKQAFGEVVRDLDRMGEKFVSARGLIASFAGTVGVVSFANMIRGTIEAQAHLVDLAAIAGTVPSQIAAFKPAADIGKIGLDGVASSIAKLSKSIGEAQLGDEGKKSLLKAIGIDPNDGRDAAQIMVDVAKAVSGMRDQNVAATVTNQLLGKSFAEMRPFMKEVADNGIIVKQGIDEQAQRAKELERQWLMLERQMGEWKKSAAAEIVPTLNDIVAALRDAQKETAEFNLLGAGTRVLFQTLTVVGSDVAFTFRMVGGEIGVIAAQINAFLDGSATLGEKRTQAWARIGEIRKEWVSDSQSARTELDAFQARVLGVGQAVAKAKQDMADGGAMDMGGSGSIFGNYAEGVVRARMLFEKEYPSLIAAAEAFSKRYAAAIRTGDQLVQEANKQGRLTDGDTLRQLQASNDARLAVDEQMLTRELALAQKKGDLVKAAQTKQALEQVRAERVAAEAIAKARIDTLAHQQQLDSQQRNRAASDEDQADANQAVDKYYAGQVAKYEILRNSLASQTELETQARDDRLLMLASMGDQELALLGGYKAAAVQIELQYQAKLGNVVAQAELARRELVGKSLTIQASYHLNIMSDILQGAGQHNREMFELEKGVSMGIAVVKGYEAIQKAYAWGSTWGGPVGGAAMAAIAAAATAINVAAIANTSYGGGNAQPVFQASPSTGLPSALTDTSSQAPPPSVFDSGVQQAPVAQVQEIHIHVDGGPGIVQSWLRDELAPAMKEASGDGVQFIVERG